MLTGIDSRTMAFVNMFGVLGTLENLCELVPQAKELLKDKPPVSIGFSVKGGPQATFLFSEEKCQVKADCTSCDIKLAFSSCEKFNGMIEGTVTPIPTKGFTKISFLLKTFTPLTDLLSKYLKPSTEDLKDITFREISTKLTLFTAAASIAQVGNEDLSGQFSAGLMPDGDISIEVFQIMGVTLQIKNHKITTVKSFCENPRAVMSFLDLEVARQLLGGEISAMACICDGRVTMKGMLNMIDNMNRILDRVGQYLSA